jgi:hypothetical protein
MMANGIGEFARSPDIAQSVLTQWVGQYSTLRRNLSCGFRGMAISIPN